MSVLTLFMTFKEKNYIMFAIQKDSAGVVSGILFQSMFLRDWRLAACNKEKFNEMAFAI